MGFFQNLRNFLFGHFLDFGRKFFGNLFEIFWEGSLDGFFFGGIFWEKFLWRIFLGEIFWEEFFGRNSLFTLLKSPELFEYERD